jgi:thioesterase superfamily protein 4
MASGAIFRTPSEKVKEQFANTPWAIKFFDDATLRPFDPSLTVNTFIGKTCSTPEAILAWQYFQRPPASPDTYSEVIGLVKLGNGVNGHETIAHGGFCATLLDETAENATDFARPEGKSTMTAYLKVQYKKPVRTPGIILTRAAVVKGTGRKLLVRATIEDGKGGILAEAEALFVIVGIGSVKL